MGTVRNDLARDSTGRRGEERKGESGVTPSGSSRLRLCQGGMVMLSKALKA